MGLLFVCPNCRRVVDPMSHNAAMAAATKLWQHKDCASAPDKTNAQEIPKPDRRRRPRR